MSQPIQVDDQNPPPGDDDNQPNPEDNPRISSSEPSKTSTDSLPSNSPKLLTQYSRLYATPHYPFPCDAAEHTRLTILHQLSLPLLDSHLTLAHIPPTTKRILDIGTGTADWAVSIASAHPNAEVLATDITSAFLPTSAPANLTFEIDDLESEWTYTHPFDFIHVRGLTGAFADWSGIYSQITHNLVPSGTCEVCDAGAIHIAEHLPQTHTVRFNEAIKKASEGQGRKIGLEHLEREAFEKVGLSVVRRKRVDVPMGGGGGGKVGKMALVAGLEGVEAVGLRVLGGVEGGEGGDKVGGEEGDKVGGEEGGQGEDGNGKRWRELREAEREEKVRELIEGVKEEVVGAGGRAWWEWRWVVARKI